MKPDYLYHWTHKSNVASILASGLLPSFARGKMKVVWACDSTRVGWAVAHVASHHQCSPDDMVCLKLDVRGVNLKRSAWPQVYVNPHRYAPSRVVAILPTITGRWVSRRAYRARTARTGRTDRGIGKLGR